MNISHLATGKWFYTHGFETMMIIAVLFSLIGFFFGFLLWRHYQFQVKRIHKINNELRDKKDILENQQHNLSAVIQDLSD